MVRVPTDKERKLDAVWVTVPQIHLMHQLPRQQHRKGHGVWGKGFPTLLGAYFVVGAHIASIADKSNKKR
jgi:hypothetical protein